MREGAQNLLGLLRVGVGCCELRHVLSVPPDGEGGCDAADDAERADEADDGADLEIACPERGQDEIRRAEERTEDDDGEDAASIEDLFPRHVREDCLGGETECADHGRDHDDPAEDAAHQRREDARPERGSDAGDGIAHGPERQNEHEPHPERQGENARAELVPQAGLRLGLFLLIGGGAGIVIAVSAVA